MSDILCLDDVPYQCPTCETRFPTENSLGLHYFVKGHGTLTVGPSRNCYCGEDPDEPHRCDSCSLIGISVDDINGRREAPNNDKVYTQSQLWKCSGCGMLWKCTECSLYFKGAAKFKNHLPRCNSIEDVLRRMKREKVEREDDIKGDMAIDGANHNPDVKRPLNPDLKLNIKEEKFDPDVKCPLKTEVNANIKQEGNATDVKPNAKRDIEGNMKSESGYATRRSRRLDSKQEKENNGNH